MCVCVGGGGRVGGRIRGGTYSKKGSAALHTLFCKQAQHFIGMIGIRINIIC